MSAVDGVAGRIRRPGPVDRELDAAGIEDPALRADYRHCRELAAEHGRTYFLATRFLPPDARPAVHALYGFTRTADDIVDDEQADVQSKTEGLLQLTDQWRAALVDEARATDPTVDPSVRAAADVARRYAMPSEWFEAFLHSMAMDLTVTGYATEADLDEYVHGSAAVIGLMVTPIIGTVGPRAAAEPAAAELGVAFQLTNFLRDVGEDLRLGRVYLPADVMAAHGVDRELLAAQDGRSPIDPRVRALMVDRIAYTRDRYRTAAPGIDLLAPRGRRCVRVAYQLYGDILGAIEQADYQVFGPRVRVSRRRRASVALRALLSRAA